MEKRSALYSWPVIILFLIICWPIAIFLIIKRYKTNKKDALKVGNGMRNAGIAFLIFAIFSFVGEQPGFGVFFIIAGGDLLCMSKSTKLKAIDIKACLNLIVNEGIYDIQTIANKLGVTYDRANSLIEKMIVLGLLKDAYIDKELKIVVLNDRKESIEDISYLREQDNKIATTKMRKVVTCPCCGANNTIFTDTGECEYCGTPLK